MSVLDRTLLDDFSEASARDEVRRRLLALTSLNREAIEKSYLREHLKSRELSRANRWTFFPIDASAEVLEDAETILIGSAVRLGCPALVNRAKVRPASRLAAEGAAIVAVEAIGYWEGAGLNPTVAAGWRQEIRKLIATIIIPPAIEGVPVAPGTQTISEPHKRSRARMRGQTALPLPSRVRASPAEPSHPKRRTNIPGHSPRRHLTAPTPLPYLCGSPAAHLTRPITFRPLRRRKVWRRSAEPPIGDHLVPDLECAEELVCSHHVPAQTRPLRTPGSWGDAR